MKKLTQLALLLALVLGFVSKSEAALLIEPVVGYNVTSSFEAPSNAILTSKISSKGSGTSFGGRLGYQNLGIQLGVDYLHSSLKTDDDNLDENITMNEWGAFAGFEFPILLRVYAGYIFSATGESETSTGTKVELTEGSGMKVGVGFTGLPFIDINVEYRKGTFGELTLGSTDTGAETEYSAIMLGLSLPFTL